MRDKVTNFGVTGESSFDATVWLRDRSQAERRLAYEFAI
jgi:hypothetical protein